MIRILNAEPQNYSEEARKILCSFAEIEERHLNHKELLSQIKDFHVLIVRLGIHVDQEVMTAGSRLKAIVTATTGLDHIDLDHAKKRGIEVLSLNGETAFLRSISATAEHTWALLLSLMRNIPSAFSSVCAGEWNRDAFRGHELREKRLGLVGLGRIGEKVARMALAFEMDVAAYDPYRHDWPSAVKRFHTLTRLLPDVDIVSLHVPLNGETSGMIGDRELALLHDKAVIVNTARAEIVDEEALLHYLTIGRIAGAAIDVVRYERDRSKRKENALLSYARANTNLLMTPHIGGATVESMQLTEIFMARKLKTWIEETHGQPR
jgi:D-3-phosphoglycerate dehydrogenase